MILSGIRKFGPLLAVLAALIAAWHFSVTLFEVPAYLVPSPNAVLRRGIEAWDSLLRNSWVTLREVLLGFTLSVLVGIPLAIIIVYSRVLEGVLYPLLVASQAVPKIAIAPLLIVWVGFGPMPKVLMAFLISFFPVVIDTVVGLRSTEPEMLHLARAMRAGSLTTFLKVRIPNALPNLFGGLKIAITLAVVGAVAAEFVGADAGLGYLLVVASGVLDTPLIFAALIVLSLIGVGLFSLVAVVERVLLPWHVSQRREQ